MTATYPSSPINLNLEHITTFNRFINLNWPHLRSIAQKANREIADLVVGNAE
jgi:hypothetical protein